MPDITGDLGRRVWVTLHRRRGADPLWTGKARPRGQRPLHGSSHAGRTGDCGALIQDEIAWGADRKERAFRWQLLTDAEIGLNGGEATLTKNGQLLYARILSPPGAHFVVASAYQEPPQHPNTGFRQLVLEHSASTDETRIAVLLSTRPVQVVVRPLLSW